MRLEKFNENTCQSTTQNAGFWGVVIPAAEEASRYKRIGNLATSATVTSGAFPKEIRKLNKKAKVFQNAAPLLVPLVENDGLRWSEPILKEYLKPLLKEKIEALILGCTHYPILKKEIKKIIGNDIKIISQEEIIPKRLKDYLKRHPESESLLGKKKKRRFLLTDVTEQSKVLSKKWFGKNIKLNKVNY